MTFDPTDEQRRTVRAMSGFGVPQPDIALHLDIDPKTLRKYFRDDLNRGSIEATMSPDGSDYFYFVAKSARNHVFAKTFDEHKQNVATYAH